MIDIHAQAECERCEKLFCYFRTGTARRHYCGGCVEIERVALLAFTREQRFRQTAATARDHQSRTSVFRRFRCVGRAA
jgi:hypothetical protein